MDPEFVDELMLARMARADHELLSLDAKDNKELRQRQTKRKTELMRWRRGK